MCERECSIYECVYVCANACVFQICLCACVKTYVSPSLFLSFCLSLSLSPYLFLSISVSFSLSIYLTLSLSSIYSLSIFLSYRQIHQLMALRGILPPFIGLGLSHILPEYSNCIHNADTFFVNGLNKGKM